MKSIDLSEIGLHMKIPETWESNGAMIKRTLGEYHREVLEEPYQKSDSSKLLIGYAGFSGLEVDSTLLPDASAYASHQLNVEMHGHYGWYRRWLWSQGKRRFRESFRDFFEERIDGTMGYTGFEQLELEELDESDPRMIINDAFAFEYEWRPESIDVTFKGQMYFIVKGDRAYRLQVEGVGRYYEQHRPTYDEVLRSIEFVE